MWVTNSADVITFSQDGVNTDRAIKKANIVDVKGVFVAGSATPSNQSNPSMPYNRQAQCNVEITIGGGEKIAFDSQMVNNQPWGWPNVGTQATLSLATNTISGWL